MNVQQLKLLAGRLRGVLEQHDRPVVHGQALDLIAAVPGLRSWPEVMAFPDRVAACSLDASAAGRLAHRLKSRLHLELAPAALVTALSPPDAVATAKVTQIWPAGPAPGVYVTTSQEAINALLARYEEATDGALVYAERAGNNWEGSIDLGEQGLWSAGMNRVPSGTLLVLGPLELTQQAWDESSSRLEAACLSVLVSGHRVAVLVDTPVPATLHNDVELMVRATQPEGEDYHTALAGAVTEEGELRPHVPFVGALPSPVVIPSVAPLDAVPPIVLPKLRHALANRPTGLLVLGSTVIEEHRAIDLVAAALTLTDSLGPAARIKPRNRGTPAKDMMVPDAVKALPFLPSIESAYSLGYRRMIVHPIYTDVDLMLKYADDVLLIAGAYGLASSDLLFDACRMSFDKCAELLEHVIAVVGVGSIETKAGVVRICDMYTPGDEHLPADADYSAVADFISRNRVLRWEDELAHLLDAKRVTTSAVRKALNRNHMAEEFLSARTKKAAANDIAG